MGRGGDNGGTKACIAMTCVTAFVSAFLLGYSFDTLEADKYALMFNQNTRLLECDRIYGAERGQGSRRVFTGLGRGFYDYRFPLAAHSLVFSSTRKDAASPLIDGRTQEGASVVVELAIQYKLPRTPDKMCDLLYTYGRDYTNFYINYVRSATRDVLAGFLVSDLWKNRDAVTEAVRVATTNVLTQHFATVVNFQLLSVDIPTDLQNEIENTTVQAQAITTTYLNLQKQNVSAITRQLQARVTSQVTVINAQSSADALILDAKAQALSLNVTAYSEANSYNKFKVFFGMDNKELLTLAYLDSLLGTGADHIAISASTPGLLLPSD